MGSEASLTFLSSLLKAGIAEQLVMAILLLTSVVSWGIVFSKTRLFRRATRQSKDFLVVFWGTKRLDQIYQKAESFTLSPVAQVFRAGYVELAKIKKSQSEPDTNAKPPLHAAVELESVERAMLRSSIHELSHLEERMPFLATTGSVAPFVGLFGTVVGIMNAFTEIGVQNNANLATVAPGVGGALVATAVGLFAAIPAVVAYNFLGVRLRQVEVQLQTFTADFLNIVKRHFF